jgi:hypothetical protein
VTGALRVRRHRAKKKLSGTNAVFTVAGGPPAITTPEMCALAARVGDGRATPGDLELAERLIMALMDRLPAGLTWRRTTLSKSPAPPRTFTVADAHALADRLERSQRSQSDQAIAAKLIRALLAGRAAGDVIVLQDE